MDATILMEIDRLRRASMADLRGRAHEIARDADVRLIAPPMQHNDMSFRDSIL